MPVHVNTFFARIDHDCNVFRCWNCSAELAPLVTHFHVVACPDCKKRNQIPDTAFRPKPYPGLFKTEGFK